MTLVLGSRRTRTAFAAFLVLASASTLLPTSAAAKPGDAPAPTVASVTAKLDTLAHTTERLAEEYNKARLDVVAAQHAADRARRAAAAAATQYQDAHSRFVQVITSQYENGSPSTADALLNSNSGVNYLDRLNTLNLVSRQQSDVVTHLRTTKATQTRARTNADGVVRAAETKRRKVSDQRDLAAAQTKKFTKLLATLTAAQQAAYTARTSASPTQTASVTKVHAGSAAAQHAVDFALAQVGKPYVFGAAGPGSYDCSGLTMAAWRAGGVSLPHLAASQINYGTRVSASQLQPGDLVFLYNPIGHVSMYIGHGMLVSAPQPGENVKIVPFSHFTADFVGGTRLA